METKNEQKMREESWEREFSTSPDLRAEFGGSLEAFLAFRKAEAAGRVRGLKSSVPASGAAAEAVDEEIWKQEFAASEVLKNEFGDVTSYLSFKKAEAAGRAKVCRAGGVVSFSAPAPKTEERISDKGIPISEPVRSAFREAVRRAEEIRKNEARQYQKGVSCQA